MGKSLIAVIVLTIFVSLQSEVTAKPSLTIINGTTAAEGEFPYMVQMCDANGVFLCGGSILAPEWILTAGHCVQDGYIAYGTIKVCSPNEPLPNTSIEIKNKFRHPNFTYITDDGIPIYDLGILQLAEPIPFSENVQPIQIVESNANTPFHVQGVAIGWGMAEWWEPSPTYLQKIYVPLLTDAECIEKNNDYKAGDYTFFPIHNLCSDGLNQGVNYVSAMPSDITNLWGDSGSPYIINGTQYGITSWGFYPGIAPDAYTRISNPDYRDWIRNITGI